MSHEYISVTFEHPSDESTATAELDLTDLCSVRCKLYTMQPDPNNTFCSDEFATKVLQRCVFSFLLLLLMWFRLSVKHKIFFSCLI